MQRIQKKYNRTHRYFNDSFLIFFFLIRIMRQRRQNNIKRDKREIRIDFFEESKKNIYLSYIKNN